MHNFLWAYDDVIKCKHIPRYWPFVRGIHRSPVNSPHKGQWRGALIFSLICAWINGWLNNREAGDLRRHRAHYDVIVMRCCQRRQSWHHDDSLMVFSNIGITCTNFCEHFALTHNTSHPVVYCSVCMVERHYPCVITFWVFMAWPTTYAFWCY